MNDTKVLIMNIIIKTKTSSFLNGSVKNSVPDNGSSIFKKLFEDLRFLLAT